MRGLILACLVVIAVNASSLEEIGAKFQSYKLQFGKTYKNQAEETKRFNIFKDNVQAMEEHNVLYEHGLSSYKQGINQFADMTLEEFKNFLRLSSANKPQFNGTKYVRSQRVAYPDSVDWRTQGQVTEVKNQGDCGSCWSFSVTGSTEGAYKRKSGQLVSLSEQELIDCSTEINGGCNGGYLDLTFPWIQQYGLQSESSYPYTAKDESCKYNADAVVTRIDGFTYFNQGDEGSLLDAVANVGPVSVAMDASYLGYYSSGIYDDNQCSASELNHGVLIVGYGSENGRNYWIVKNSWSADFGEQGYFRLLRGTNQCGIAQDMCYPYIY